MRSFSCQATLVIGFLIVVWDSPTVAAVDYAKDIKPLLAEKCYACHGALAQESSLRLETRELMLRGGDSGPALEPGNADGSLLLERVVADDSDRMPPAEHGSPMTAEQIHRLRRWIDEGAKAPSEPIPPAPSEHWAFQPVKRPAIPEFEEIAHPVDALLQTRRKEAGIRSQLPAARSIQIRRLYLDLIGLPPTAEQLDDPRPWTEIVDDLLSKPQHGERWARHWMDIWRYCDWYGLGQQLRYSQKHLWRWRDWIVESINSDKGYDRMILEMIAGDELEPANPQVVVATGFLARNYYLFNRTTWLDNTIEHTGKAFLGLTLNCAKCHDHKYDPISQRDYYQMRAIFEPHQVRLDPIPGVTDFEKDGLPRVFDDHVNLPTYLHVRGDPKNPDTSDPLEPAVPAILRRFAERIEPIDLPPEAHTPSIRNHVLVDHLRQLDGAVKRAEDAAADARRALANAKPDDTGENREATRSSNAFSFVETFDELNPELWKVSGSGWEIHEGSLLQTVSSRDEALLQLNRDMPRNFEVECTFTTTGGDTYKSVTFHFDQTPAGDSNYVYTSAHAPGPKVQAAYRRGGKSVYPAEARRAAKIEVGRSYKLRFAVRDKLVNVWLDDQFQFAYQYPDRPEGAFGLSGFDATVAFDHLEIRSLDPNRRLQPASGTQPPQDLETAVAVADANLGLARAKRIAFESAWRADRARAEKLVAEELAVLEKNAALHQIESEIAAAKLAVVESGADKKKSDAAQERLVSAEKKFREFETSPRVYNSIRASKKALESPADKEADYPASYSPVSTGRRLSLARWMASKQNPLTARVAVNHVWLRHFGTPLVESVFDFGLRAKRPVQIDLLDFLAYEFMASGWSFQHLHRLIVTSDAYRSQSTTLDADPNALQIDPGNTLYWRMNARRMESQVVRDSLLHIGGKLDPTLGGPSLDPKSTSYRRSLYFLHSRDQQDKFLEMFDDADELQCYRRSESIVPQQALALSNSKLALEMSAEIAGRLSQHSASQSSFIQAVFRSLLGRDPSDEEVRHCDQYFKDLADASNGTPPAEAKMKARFVHAILNHNDFVTIR